MRLKNWGLPKPGIAPSKGSLERMSADEILGQLTHYVKRWKRASLEHGEEAPITLALKQEYEDAKTEYVERRRQEGAR